MIKIKNKLGNLNDPFHNNSNSNSNGSKIPRVITQQTQQTQQNTQNEEQDDFYSAVQYNTDPVQYNTNSVPIQEQPPIVEQNSISFSSILIGGILGVCLGSALEKQTLSLNNNKPSNSILFN